MMIDSQAFAAAVKTAAGITSTEPLTISMIADAAERSLSGGATWRDGFRPYLLSSATRLTALNIRS